MCQTWYQACAQKQKLNPMQFNFKECSMYPSITCTKLLGQKKEKLNGFLWSKTPCS